jgi:amino acid adenylation domain-containing protein/non-ribosomal peptide synthase protein (TIGR01720 family)
MLSLSEAQKEILLVEYFYPNSSATTVGVQISFGRISIKKVIIAVETLMSFHNCFKMKLRENGEEIERYYDKKVSTITEHYCSEDEVKFYIDKKSSMNFFGWNQYLYEIDVYQTTQGDVYLSLFANHMLMDGIAIHLFVKGVCDLIEGKECQKPLLTFDECVQEEQAYRQNKRNDKNKIFWREKIRNYEGSSLCGSKQVSLGQLKTSGYLGRLGLELTQKVTDFCEKNNVSLTQLLSGVLLFYKSKMTNSNSVSLATTLHGRSNRMKKTVLSTFARVYPMIVDIDSSMSVLNYLAMIKSEMSQLVRNYRISYGDLVDIIDNVPGLNDISLSVQVNEELRKTYSNASGGWVKAKESIKPLVIHVKEEDDSDSLYFDYEFQLSMFTLNKIEEIHNKLKNILSQMLSSTSQLLKDISVIDEQECELITKVFNDTNSEYPRQKTIVELFEEQVEKTPDHIAVVFEEMSISYQELNERANVLAHKLRDLGIKPDDYVAIMTERSIEMIVGIYGIIKAGGAYVPLDLAYPQERIDYILEDCQPKVLLINQKEISVEQEIPILNLMDQDMFTGKVVNPKKINQASDLLYLIYTSGTTGNPKGVMVEHKNLHNYLMYAQSSYITKKPVVPLFTNYTFDLTVTSLFLPLICGGKLIIYNGEIYEDIRNIFMNKEITLIKLTPSHLKMALIMESKAVLDQLETVISGGEELDTQTSYQTLVKYGEHIKIHNEYGPTETTIGCCDYIYELGDNEKATVSIGRPISNTQLYIINENELCGVDIPGELCIAGDGVTRGYLNRSDLTAEKFVDNPYGEGKLYKTGDLARWLQDGNLEYLGRIDEQVKIRGHRIELGEIENALRNQLGIKNCTVIARSDKANDKVLYGYIVSEEEIDMNDLKENLSKKLPEYMIPAYMVQIDSIPLTTNGKIDKRSLPKIEVCTGVEYVAPRNKKEAVLSEIFKEVLGVENASVKDSFFALGGDSIKAIRVVSKMREAGYDLNVKDVMGGRTIEAMSENVGVAKELTYEQGEVVGKVKSTPIIKAFESWKFSEPYHFNQSIIVKVEGTDKEVEESIRALVSHHDMLRAVYKEGSLYILGNEEKRYEYEIYDYREDNNIENKMERICDVKQRSMNLEKGPLFKCILFQTIEGNYLFMCTHHLVVDGVSWRILVEDLYSGIAQSKEGKGIELPKKTASFKEWSEVLNEYKESKQLSKEIAFWRKIEEEMSEWRYEGKEQGIESSYQVESFRLSEEETTKLLKESGVAYSTEINDLLLSALGMAIKEVRKQDKIAITLEGHGREELHKKIEVDRTVGWFTSMYPIILTCYEEIEESIIQTKEMLRKIPNYGIGYGLLSEQVEADISFNYLGEIAEISEVAAIYHTGADVSEKNRLSSGIIINGVVQNGRLMFAVSYDQSKYSEEEMVKLVRLYNEKLLETVYYCTTKNETVKTPSDFSWNNATINSLDILKDIFRNTG